MELEIVKYVAIFLFSLAILGKSADYLTTYAEKLGLILGIKPFIIGLTIIAVGTSLPELITSLFAVVNGSTEIVAADIVGSNIANILLGLGIAAIMVKKYAVEKSLILLDLPLLAIATIMYILIIMDGSVTIPEAIILLLGYLVYAYYSTTEGRHIPHEKAIVKNGKLTIDIPIVLALSAVALYFSSEFTIKSVIELSALLNIGTDIIAISAISIGTSLPEIVVCITAIRKGSIGIGVGNIIGSNIFNIFLVGSIPAFIAPLTVSPQTIQLGVPFLIGAVVIFILSGIERKIFIYEGFLYLLVYALFITKLIQTTNIH